MFNTVNKNANPIWQQEVPKGAQTSDPFQRTADEDKCFQTEGEVLKLYLNTAAGQPVDPNNGGNNTFIPINIPTIKTLPMNSVVYVSSVQIDTAPGTGFLDIRSDTFMDSQRYDSGTGQHSNILKRVQPTENLQLFEDVRNTSGTTIRDGQALNFQQVHISITDDRGLLIPLAGTGGDQAYIELTIIMPYAKKNNY